jgi:hypothetical protein
MIGTNGTSGYPGQDSGAAASAVVAGSPLEPSGAVAFVPVGDLDDDGQPGSSSASVPFSATRQIAVHVLPAVIAFSLTADESSG